MPANSIKTVFLLLVFLVSTKSFSQVSYDQQKEEWTLRSGRNNYVITNTPKGIEKNYLTDAVANSISAAEPDYNVISCAINGQQINATDFTLTNHQTGSESNGVTYLTLTLQAKNFPLQAIVITKA